MTQAEILQELKKLTPAERLAFIEAALHLIREDLEQEKDAMALPERERKLALAAQALLPDYAGGGELTAFTTLDSEDFHA